MKRIVHVVPHLGTGGAERVAADLARGMKNEFDTSIVSVHAPANTRLTELLKESRVAVHSLAKRPGLDLRMLWRVPETLRRIRPDLVHTHLSVLPYVLPYTLAAQCPVVHTLHNVATREVRRAIRFAYRLGYHLGVIPVAVAGEVATTFRAVYGRTPSIIYNGTETGGPRRCGCGWRRQVGLPLEAVVFACIGRLAPQKNPTHVLKAFLQGPAKKESTVLVFAGEGELRPEVEQMIRVSGIGQRIRCLGHIEDVTAMLAGIDVVVLGSNWEGHPLTLIEGMAAGRPAVATRVGGVPEALTNGRNGLLVEPGDDGALASAMTLLAEEPALRVTLAAAALEDAARKFTIQATRDAYLRLYKSLV